MWHSKLCTLSAAVDREPRTRLDPYMWKHVDVVREDGLCGLQTWEVLLTRPARRIDARSPAKPHARSRPCFPNHMALITSRAMEALHAAVCTGQRAAEHTLCVIRSLVWKRQATWEGSHEASCSALLGCTSRVSPRLPSGTARGSLSNLYRRADCEDRLDLLTQLTSAFIPKTLLPCAPSLYCHRPLWPGRAWLALSCPLLKLHSPTRIAGDIIHHCHESAKSRLHAILSSFTA